MRDPEVYAEHLGELPEDYRNIYDSVTISAPGAVRYPAGRWPLAGRSPQRHTRTMRLRQQPSPEYGPGYDAQATALMKVCYCIEERLRSIQMTAARPSWIDPPIDSITIDKWNDDPDDVAPAVDGAFTTLFSFTIPDFHLCRISKFGQWLEFQEAFESVDWVIAVNDNPVPGIGTDCFGQVYHDFRQQLGTIANPGDVFVTAKGNDTVSILVRNNLTTSSVGVKARLVGWAFRQKYDTESAGAGAWIAF